MNGVLKITDLEKLSTQELLISFSNILDELKSRDVLRTRNNPVGDYGEWIVSKKLNLLLACNSTEGYDAIDVNGLKFQIKCRRQDKPNKSKQLGTIRDLENKKFDFLIGLIFTKDFQVVEAYKIPHSIIGNYAKYKTRINGHVLRLRGDLIKDPAVENIISFF